MKIHGIGTEAYLFVNGLETTLELELSENASLLPVNKPLLDVASKLLKNDVNFAIAILSAQTILSQWRICEFTSFELAKEAWKAQ